MWARVVEIILGIWLLCTPFIFGSGKGDTLTDIICGLVVIILASLSLVSRFVRAHFFILVVAVWLAAIGYLAGYPAPPAAQNRIIIGILIAMFAIIPTRIGEMPDSWQRLHAGKENIDQRG